jgi:hypothetical protein
MMTEDLHKDWKRGDPIGYIQPDIPEVNLPPCNGERYEALVPDTLDLAERARLAIHGMTEPTDPEADYEVYWHVLFRCHPPMMRHEWPCTTIRPKFEETVSLMRIMCGSNQNSHVEQRWVEVGLKMQGPDGLLHTPARGRPWAYPQSHEDWEMPEEGSDQWVEPFTNGRALSALVLHWLRDGNPLWKEAACRLVDGLVELAVDDGRGAYFWPSVVYGIPNPPPGVAPRTTWTEAEFSRIAMGLVHAHNHLGYEPALSLAGKLITHHRKHFYMPDGTFLQTPGEPRGAHCHAHTHGLLAMCEYALAAGDSELMEFVLRGYDYAKRIGNTLLGYFPEWVDSDCYHTSEICEVSDMITLALRLSEAGVGDFWDDADRWLRNMLAEGQLLTTDWIYRLVDADWTYPWEIPPSEVDPVTQTNDRVPERNLGGFAGWPAANDWFTGMGSGIMLCCTANGARSLFMIWNRILTYKEGKLAVNLLLNRASKWADIDSYIPYQGRVVIKVKQPLQLSVRIPEWVSPEETRASVNDAECTIQWDGRYARIGKVQPEDAVTVTFPIAERTEEIHVEKRRYRIVRKGNEVVSIDPPGRYNPLYQREHYRSESPRWRKVTRFIPNEHINWT